MEQLSEEKRGNTFILNSKPPSNNYKERVIELFKKNDFGLTIADLSKKVGTTGHTISLVLAELKGAELVEIRKVGVAKIHVLPSLQKKVVRDER